MLYDIPLLGNNQFSALDFNYQMRIHVRTIISMNLMKCKYKHQHRVRAVQCLL